MHGGVLEAAPRGVLKALDPVGAATRAQCDVEDLIASSSESDALSRLQDFVADYAPSLRDSLMSLRERHEQIRSQTRSRGADPTAINRIRNDILELTAEAADLTARGAQNVQPPPQQSAQVGSTQAAPAPAPDPGRDSGGYTPPKKQTVSKPPPKAEDVVCSLEGVTRTFGKGKFKLDPITLDIRKGAITAIAGRNASGKTTLLSMILGELLPTSGSVSYPALDGHRKRKDWKRIKAQIASLPQFPEKWHGRLRYNLNYVAAVYGHKDQDLAKFVDWLIGRFDLMRFRDSSWDEISGGYKIRFELVRALLTQPRLLVLDEPLAYLDVVARERFLRDIRAIADSIENPLPIVITSQHLSEIEAIADQIVLLDDGVVKYSGHVSDIAQGRRHRVIEVALVAPQAAVETALAGARLQGIEATVEGYILAFPKEDEIAQIYTRLSAAFGPKFTMMRDITGSVRSIMSNVGA
ncbi:MAG: ABC transporter ATP-binding protein [Pseudomonadota bacterium]